MHDVANSWPHKRVLEYTKSNSSASGGVGAGGEGVHLFACWATRLHDLLYVVALCGCNTAREEKQEKQQGGGALVLWHGEVPLSASGNVYNYKGFIATLIEYLFWSRTCVVSSSPPLTLPCRAFFVSLFWLCLLFVVCFCVCVLQDSCAYSDAQKTHWLHGPDTLIKRTSCTEPQTAELLNCTLHPTLFTRRPAPFACLTAF